MQRLDPATLDLSAFIRPGDRVLCAQTCAEPSLLAAALPAAHAAVGPFETFVGTVVSTSFDQAPETMAFAGYGAMGRAARLARRGQLDVWPLHYSALEAGFASGAIRADVVLLQLTRGPGGYCATLANDYVLAAARHARCVIAQVNARAPWCVGAELDPGLRIDAVVETETGLVEAASAPSGETEAAIARYVAGLVPDGATIQIGVGALPDAVLDALEGHRDLGIHSGVLADRMAGLIARGVVTNARKTLEPGISVGNLVIATQRLFNMIDGNPAFALRPAAHTHAIGTLARQERLVTINSGIEVDLLGQVNAEHADGQPVGGTGGLVDFTRGARLAPNGRAILVLRATDRSGERSRIVPRVQAVTIGRADVDTVVTEYGVAELAHLGAAERVRALIAIAAPQHREMLERALREGGAS